MNRIFSLIVFLSVIVLPLQGFCSFIENARDFGYSGSDEHSRSMEALPKCLLLIDKIYETKEQEKQRHLKTILEVEILFILDCHSWSIEQTKIEMDYFDKLLTEVIAEGREKEIIDYQNALDHCHHNIEYRLNKIEELQQQSNRIRCLLKHTL